MLSAKQHGCIIGTCGRTTPATKSTPAHCLHRAADRWCGLMFFDMPSYCTIVGYTVLLQQLASACCVLAALGLHTLTACVDACVEMM
jgi:hypothetical protein